MIMTYLGVTTRSVPRYFSREIATGLRSLGWSFQQIAWVLGIGKTTAIRLVKWGIRGDPARPGRKAAKR